MSSTIITTHKKHLLARCWERGYSIEEVMPCILSQDGDIIVVDTEHPAYPKPKNISSGPGGELKLLLSKIGIKATPGCSCNKRAKLMDENEAKEPGWCEKNIETICDWLQEEATKRKLPFLRTAGKILIRKAISNFQNKSKA